MTGAARAIHEALVAEEGYDPTSDEYYAEIDKRMRREMPQKFQGDKKNVQSVTPAGSGNRSLKADGKSKWSLIPVKYAWLKDQEYPWINMLLKQLNLKIGETDMADRTSRDTQTRERQERKVWRPGSALEAPEPLWGINIVGFVNP